MLCVSLIVFDVIVQLIQNDPIFQNKSNHAQSPVDYQLAVTLYRMGCFGNATLLEDIVQMAGCSQGSVEAFTDCHFTAIESLHDQYVQQLSDDEKEQEKEWIDHAMGFKGLWHEGWVMYDGTIVVLYAKPGQQGDAYYTRKGNYGLNVQVSSTINSTEINISIFLDWQRSQQPPYC